MSSSWNREMATMSNSLWWFRLFHQNPLRKYVPRRFLQKDENEGWDLYENLTEKTIQWEPTSETSRNLNSISSKGGLHSIESSIANEAKLANLERRLEVLKTKEPSQVNQVSPNQFPTPGCTYRQAMNHVFEECPVFQAQQQYHEPMNAAFSRPNNNPYAPTYNPGWRNHPNFSWS